MYPCLLHHFLPHSNAFSPAMVFFRYRPKRKREDELSEVTSDMLAMIPPTTLASSASQEAALLGYSTEYQGVGSASNGLSQGSSLCNSDRLPEKPSSSKKSIKKTMFGNGNIPSSAPPPDPTCVDPAATARCMGANTALITSGPGNRNHPSIISSSPLLPKLAPENIASFPWKYFTQPLSRTAIEGWNLAAPLMNDISIDFGALRKDILAKNGHCVGQTIISLDSSLGKSAMLGETVSSNETMLCEMENSHAFHNPLRQEKNHSTSCTTGCCHHARKGEARIEPYTTNAALINERDKDSEESAKGNGTAKDEASDREGRVKVEMDKLCVRIPNNQSLVEESKENREGEKENEEWGEKDGEGERQRDEETGKEEQKEPERGRTSPTATSPESALSPLIRPSAARRRSITASIMARHLLLHSPSPASPSCILDQCTTTAQTPMPSFPTHSTSPRHPCLSPRTFTLPAILAAASGLPLFSPPGQYSFNHASSALPPLLCSTDLSPHFSLQSPGAKGLCTERKDCNGGEDGTCRSGGFDSYGHEDKVVHVSPEQCCIPYAHTTVAARTSAYGDATRDVLRAPSFATDEALGLAWPDAMFSMCLPAPTLFGEQGQLDSLSPPHMKARGGGSIQQKDHSYLHTRPALSKDIGSLEWGNAKDGHASLRLASQSGNAEMCGPSLGKGKAEPSRRSSSHSSRQSSSHRRVRAPPQKKSLPDIAWVQQRERERELMQQVQLLQAQQREMSQQLREQQRQLHLHYQKLSSQDLNLSLCPQTFSQEEANDLLEGSSAPSFEDSHDGLLLGMDTEGGLADRRSHTHDTDIDTGMGMGIAGGYTGAAMLNGSLLSA